jgi:hypothetical protein
LSFVRYEVSFAKQLVETADHSGMAGGDEGMLGVTAHAGGGCGLNSTE